MRPDLRLERLEAALDMLRQEAAGAAVIVEGRRDAEALEVLGVGGEHILLNTGQSLEVRIDEIAELAQARGWSRVILLMDWDRTGGRLAKRLQLGLAARVPLDVEHRRRVGAAAHATAVQELPGDLASLRRACGRPT